MFTNDLRRGWLPAPSTHAWVTMAVALAVVMLVVMQIASSRAGIEGPIQTLLSDYVRRPRHGEVPWAGLGMAMVGLSNRRRVIALSAAAGIDLVFATARFLLGGGVAVGNGALIVLTGLTVLVSWRWSGEADPPRTRGAERTPRTRGAERTPRTRGAERTPRTRGAERTPRTRGAERTSALRGIAFGWMLILASEVGDAWLHITALVRPTVLDQYLLLADHSLAQPSWLVGRLLDAAGPIPSVGLHIVYIELPLAAMVVAVYQLRNVTRAGWPQHFLVRTFLAVGLIGPVIYFLFPVVGPEYAFGVAGHGFQLGNLWPHALPPVDMAPATIAFDTSTPRNCMPSMHTGWALAVFLHSRGGPRWLRWCGTLWLVGTLTATLGFGYHYGVDLVAGGVLCLTVESALHEPERGWAWWRIRLVAGGAMLLATMLLCFRYLAQLMEQLPLVFGPLVLGALAVYVVAFYATFFGQPRGAAALRDRVAMYGAELQGNRPQPDALYD